MAESLELSVGDRLVYPNQGLCTVTEIKHEEIAGQKLVFVSLVITETNARVKVPQEKLVKNGVRRVSTPAEVKAVFEFLTGESERASLDWKKRARDNTARLSEGGLKGLAEVVKGLQVLSELRPLPPKEREQYNDARHLFVEELAAAASILPADAEDALDIVLFPVGRDRPKRSIEEFQALVGADEDLGLGDDLLGLDAEPVEPDAEPEVDVASAGANDDEETEAAPAAASPPPPARAVKAAKAPKSPRPAVPEAAAPEAPKKKRGRPPKARPALAIAAAPPPAKKRGRPAKAEAPAPKKRGRPTRSK
jgi:RNA polymerase-interacting CarD/CdnL/TRCF family regulator